MSATPINHKIALDVFELTCAIQSPSEEFGINTLSITKFAFSMHFKLTKMKTCKPLDYKEHQNIPCIKKRGYCSHYTADNAVENTLLVHVETESYQLNLQCGQCRFFFGKMSY